TAGGQLDTTFNGNGVLETLPSGDATLGFGDVAMQGSRIVVTGTFTTTTGGADPDGFVARYGIVSRYNLNGTLDTTFGAGRSFTSDLWGASVAVAGDGSLLIPGARQTPVFDGSGNRVHDANGNLVTYTDSAVAHLTVNGTLDTSFGTAGIGYVTLAMGP